MENVNDTNEQIGQENGATGKFESVAQLLAAYNALEREFTKRCQLVKQLQAALIARGAQADIINAPDESVGCEQPSAAAQGGTVYTSPDANSDREQAESAPAVVAAIGKVGETAADVETENARGTADGEEDRVRRVIAEVAMNAEMYAPALTEIPLVMDACLEKYKKKLIGFAQVPPPPGMAVIVPRKKPASLAEAKRLADELLK